MGQLGELSPAASIAVSFGGLRWAAVAYLDGTRWGYLLGLSRLAFRAWVLHYNGNRICLKMRNKTSTYAGPLTGDEDGRWGCSCSSCESMDGKQTRIVHSLTGRKDRMWWAARSR